MVWNSVVKGISLFCVFIFLGPVQKTARGKMPVGVCIGVRKSFVLCMSECIVGLLAEEKKLYVWTDTYSVRFDQISEASIILSKSVLLSLSLYVPFVLLKSSRPHGYEFLYSRCYCIYFFFHFIRFDVSPIRYSTILSFTWRDCVCMCVVNCIGCSE